MKNLKYVLSIRILDSIVSIFLTIILMLIFLIPGLLINTYFKYIENAIEVPSVTVIAALFVISALTNVLFIYLSGIYALRSNFFTGNYLRSKIIDKIIFMQHNTNLSEEEVYTRINDDVEIVQESINWVFDYIGQAVFALTALAIITFIDPKITFFAVLPLLFIFIIVRLLQPKLEERANRSRESAARVSNAITSTISMSESIISYDAAGYSVDKISYYGLNRMIAAINYKVLSEIISNISRNTSNISTILIMSITALLSSWISITLSEFALLIIYLPFVVSLVSVIGDTAPQWRILHLSIRRIEEMLSTDITRLDDISDRVVDSQTITGFDIMYMSTGDNNLEAGFLKICIAPGDILLVKGANGSGKTIFLRSIFGLEVQDNLRILSDEKNISSLLYSNAIYLSSSPYILSDNLIENFHLFGINNLNIIQAALRDACLDFEVGNRLESPLLDGGTGLSEGQKQRLALARALATQPKYLFLDDALNAIDPQTVKQIYKNLKNSKITLMLSTNTDSIELEVNHIIELENQKIVNYIYNPFESYSEHSPSLNQLSK